MRLGVIDPRILPELQQNAELTNAELATRVMESYLRSGDADNLLWVVVTDLPELEQLIVRRLSRIGG